MHPQFCFEVVEFLSVQENPTNKWKAGQTHLFLSFSMCISVFFQVCFFMKLLEFIEGNKLYSMDPIFKMKILCKVRYELNL